MSAQPTGARARAEALLEERPTIERAFCTDTESKPGAVIVGIAIRGVASAAIVMDAAEWNASSWQSKVALANV